MKRFLDRYLPCYQMPEAGGGGSTSAPSPSGVEPASTPVSTPAPASVESSAPEPAANTDVDLSFIFGNEGDDPADTIVAPVVTPPVAATPAPPPVPPVPPAGVEPAKPATPAPAVPAEPVTPAAPAPTEPTSAAAPQLDPFDPTALASALVKDEAAAVQHVADTIFKLSDEEIEALESNTAETVPKLLAKAFIKSQVNMLQQMGRLVPMMVTRHGVVMKRHAENEGKFYSRWPDIKADNEQHKALVNQYAAVYRQMNPTSTLQEMIERLGPMVMMAANIVPTLPGAQPASTSPLAPAGLRPPQPSPFQPAGPVGGGATPSTPQQLSDVEMMFAQHDE